MKNTRKKVLPLLLAGILLLSAGAYGTRAYFTDSKEQDMQIKLTLGELKIGNVDDDGWKYMPEEAGPYTVNKQLQKVGVAPENQIVDLEKEDVLGKEITLSNVRPGDAFERAITFKNEGTLDLVVTFNDDELDQAIPSPYMVTIVNTSNGVALSEGFLLEPGEISTYTVKVSILVGTTSDNTYNNPNKLALEYLDKAIIVNAIQPNAPVTP